MISLLAIFFGSVVGIYEASVRPFLPVFLDARPLLSLIVCLLVMGRRGFAWRVALVAGLMADAFHLTAPYGSPLRFLLVVFCVDFPLRHWLTNQSLYASVLLVLLARLLETVSAWIMQVMMGWVGAAGQSLFVFPPLRVWVWDIALVSGWFLCATIWSNRSKLSIRSRARSRLEFV